MRMNLNVALLAFFGRNKNFKHVELNDGKACVGFNANEMIIWREAQSVNERLQSARNR